MQTCPLCLANEKQHFGASACLQHFSTPLTRLREEWKRRCSLQAGLNMLTCSRLLLASAVCSRHTPALLNLASEEHVMFNRVTAPHVR